MEIVGCVAGIFLLLGVACVLRPEALAEWGLRLDTSNPRRSHAILARYAHVTRWTGRIVGGLLLLVGAILLLVARG